MEKVSKICQKEGGGDGNMELLMLDFCILVVVAPDGGPTEEMEAVEKALIPLSLLLFWYYRDYGIVGPHMVSCQSMV